MKAIKFTESELEFLINHYELELLEAEAYMGEIRGILKKLGVISKEVAVEPPVKVAKKRGRPKLEKPVVKAELPPEKVEKKETSKKKGASKKKTTPKKKTAPKKRATPGKNPVAPKTEPVVAPEVNPTA
jgi:hypothetical protein